MTVITQTGAIIDSALEVFSHFTSQKCKDFYEVDLLPLRNWAKIFTDTAKYMHMIDRNCDLYMMEIYD